MGALNYCGVLEVERCLRTWVTLALDIPRYLARSALDSMPFVPIRVFQCIARSIPSSLSCERDFLGGLVVLTAGFREKEDKVAARTHR